MTSSSIQHFLLVFDHITRTLVQQDSFGTDGKRAVAAYAASEKRYQGQPAIEIVLIGSDSLDTVRITHANYFEPSAAGSKYFAGI